MSENELLIMSYVELDLVSIAMLVILLVNMIRKKIDKFMPDQYAFELTVISTISILVADVGMWVFNKASFPGAYGLNAISSMAYFVLTPIVCMCWFCYTVRKLFGMKNLRLFLFISALPATACGIMSVLSIYTGSIFYIGTDNSYERGSLFFISVILSYIYLLASVIMTIYHGLMKTKSKVRRKIYINLILFPIPTLLGSIAQTLFFGISLVWTCAAISLLIIFVNLQNDQISKDFLTGLFNRRQLSEYLDWKTGKITNNKMLVAYMLDIDRFKTINDNFGHSQGDSALYNTAQLICTCCGSGDFTARYGGDEFIVIKEFSNTEEIHIFEKKLHLAAEEFNTKHEHPYTITLSIGYSVFGTSECKDSESLVSAADAEMYKAKMKKKVASR